MKTPDIYLVFDGTSHFVIPEDEFIESEQELICKFYYMESAQAVCNKLNESCSEKTSVHFK